jgi:hypothetical protein
MALLYFLAALVAIVLSAMLVNLVTGTKAVYLEALVLAPGELELWRDEAADFAMLPRLGQAAIMSYPRLRRHTVLWTTHRLVVAQKPLSSSKRMLTHQVLFEAPASAATSADERDAAGAFAGGFYGRGFATLICSSKALGVVGGKACVRLQPGADSAAALNLAEAYVFSDRLAELRNVVAGLG